MNEIWKDIKDYEGIYKISNFGRVKNIKTNKFMKTKINNGYVYINLSKNGTQNTFKIHRLVAMAFIPNPNNYKEVNHKNECKKDNFVNNLEWCTRRYNCNYGNIQKLIHKNHFVSVLQYSTDNKLIKKYKKILDAEKETGVDHSSISKCCRNKMKTAGGFIWKYESEVVKSE